MVGGGIPLPYPIQVYLQYLTFEFLELTLSTLGGGGPRRPPPLDKFRHAR